MGIVVVQHSGPTAEPLHLTDAKLHLNLVADAADAPAYTSDDPQLTSMIAVARAVAEAETWRNLCLQCWDMYLDEWPTSGIINLLFPPLRNVEFVKYRDAAGVVHTLADTEYEVDLFDRNGRVVLDEDTDWPTDELASNNPVHVRFWTGYAIPFTAEATGNTLTAGNHPFADGDQIRLSVSGGTLPAGLAAMTDYFIRDASGNTLKLSATSGGAAIDFTTAGTGNMFIGEIPPMIMAGMKLVLTDLFMHRGDTIVGKNVSAMPVTLPRAASHLFAFESVRVF